MDAFKVNVSGRILDYRKAKNLNLLKVKAYFETKYKVDKIWSGGRHVPGVLKKGNKEFFLKLATTEGISAVSKVEYGWNEQFNKSETRLSSKFWVPTNYDSGYYNGNLFYLITDKFQGEKLSDYPENKDISPIFLYNLDQIVDFSELIQKLALKIPAYEDNISYRERFVKKTISWYQNTPKNIRDKYKIKELVDFVKEGVATLQKKPRHGDFTPWHILKLETDHFGLIDGEHALRDGVEYYDIGYFIQRVFTVLQKPQLAEQIIKLLKNRNYDIAKLKTVLAARAVGGFLDDSLTQFPNYAFSDKFKNWITLL